MTSAAERQSRGYFGMSDLQQGQRERTESTDGWRFEPDLQPVTEQNVTLDLEEAVQNCYEAFNNNYEIADCVDLSNAEENAMNGSFDSHTVENVEPLKFQGSNKQQNRHDDDQSVQTILRIQIECPNSGQRDRNPNGYDLSVQIVPKTQLRCPNNGQVDRVGNDHDQSVQTICKKQLKCYNNGQGHRKLNGDDQSVQTIPKIQLRYRNNGQMDRNMNDENRSVQTVPKTQIKYHNDGQGNSKSIRDDRPPGPLVLLATDHQRCLTQFHTDLQTTIEEATNALTPLKFFLPTVSSGAIRPGFPPLPAELQSSFLLTDTSTEDKIAFLNLQKIKSDPWKTPVTPPHVTTPIYLESARRLKCDCLKDDVIAAYFSKLSERSLKTNSGKLCWFFSSYFFTKIMTLPPGVGFGDGNCSKPPVDAAIAWYDQRIPVYYNQYCYKAVQKWSSKILPKGTTIFDLHRFCIPVNFQGIHWMLCVVLMSQKEILVYDSLLSHKYDSFLVRSVVFQYILDEYQRIYGQPMSKADIEMWSFTDKVLSAPQQRNARDCGVFTALFGEYIARGLPLEALKKELQHENSYKAIVARCRLRLSAVVLRDINID